MLTHLFYILLIIPIYYEIGTITNVQKRIAGERQVLKAPNSLIVINFIYFILNIIGFFTFQWPIFLIIFIMGMVPKTKWPIWTLIDAHISIILLIFTIINKYHTQWNF